MKPAVLGIDVGGTHMRLALVDKHGAVLRQVKLKTLIVEGANRTCSRLIETCRGLMQWARDQNHQVQAVGLGVAGSIDPAHGTVIFSPNLMKLNGFPLGVELQQHLKVPVVLENDANVFGLGEHWAGAGRNISNWVGLTLGTGVGGCFILEDRLWLGDHFGVAGELGHMIIDPHGPRCACGVQGCLEAHASQSALLHGVQDALATGALIDGPLLEHSRAGTLDAMAIFACAQAGDPLARRLFHRMGWALGLALASLFTALGICHAVIGGGVSASWEAFIGPLHTSLKERSRMVAIERTSVQQSHLGDDAALLGAARLAWQSLPC
jgi:glucokinase